MQKHAFALRHDPLTPLPLGLLRLPTVCTSKLVDCRRAPFRFASCRLLSTKWADVKSAPARSARNRLFASDFLVIASIPRKGEIPGILEGTALHGGGAEVGGGEARIVQVREIQIRMSQVRLCAATFLQVGLRQICVLLFISEFNVVDEEVDGRLPTRLARLRQQPLRLAPCILQETNVASCRQDSSIFALDSFAPSGVFKFRNDRYGSKKTTTKHLPKLVSLKLIRLRSNLSRSAHCRSIP